MPEENPPTLRDLLEADLKVKIDYIWEKAREYHSSQRGDTLQDTQHCATVEKFLYTLITCKKKFNQVELFLLSAAACLHDIGKVNAKKWEDHGEKSKHVILKEYESLGLDKGHAVAVADIVSVHNHGNLKKLPRKTRTINNITVDIIELALIFRLADMLDTTYQRAPELLSRIKFPHGNVPSKWRGRQSITGWYIDGNKIIFEAEPKKEDLDAVYTLQTKTNEDLSKIAPLLKLYGYPSELKVDIGSTFLEPELKEKAVKRRPFPGMAFYSMEDAAIFAGRDNEIEDVLARVSTYPLTLLIGESGAGKTSLIHAGLFPYVEKMSWKYVWTRPFDKPVENIKKMVWDVFFEGNMLDVGMLEVMKKTAKQCGPQKVLIVMDQFEDVLNCTDQKMLDDLLSILIVVQTGTVIPNIHVLLSFREDAFVKLTSRLLDNIAGSVHQFPHVVLERLTREGAKAALEAGVKNAGFGFDPWQKEGEKTLLEMILDDIQKGSDRLYPPDVQMVAETLCNMVDEDNPVITRKMYLDLGGADTIIAHYLMERLDEFGSQRGRAETVLTSLVSSTGGKVQKNLNKLCQESEIDTDELKGILTKLVGMRMARTVGNDEFEIIHDYVGTLVVEKLVKEEDWTTKFLEEQLRAFYENYKVHGTPVTMSPFLARLYRYRRRLKEKIDEEMYPFILCTAFMGLGWYWLKDVDTGEMGKMIKDLMSHEMEEVRREAKIMFLEKIAQPEDWEKVVELLHDKNGDVQRAAAKTLKKVVQPEDWEKVVELLHDENEAVRMTAAEVLEKIAQPEDREKVIGLLDDENKYVRWAAAEVLEKIAQPEDWEKVVELLHDENEAVRKAAAKVLEKIAQPEDREKIIGLLDDEYVRRAAAKALKKVVQPEDREKVIGLLDDEYIRITAAETLEKIAQPEDWEKVVELLHDRNWYVRKAAAEILEKIAQPEDWEKVVELLHDENKAVRMTAAEALKKIVQPEDREKVIELLHDKNEYVRMTAAEALKKIVQPEDWERVIELLHDKNWNIRMTAAEILEKIVQPEDKKKIVELLHDKNWNIRWAAAKALKKIAQPEDWEIVVELLHVEVLDIRRATAEILEKIVQPEDWERVIELLHDKDGDIRMTAAEILEKIAQPEDWEKVVELLHDENEAVRMMAANLLLKMPNTEEKEHLLDVLADQAQGYGKKQIDIFNVLSRLDRMLYRPY